MLEEHILPFRCHEFAALVVGNLLRETSPIKPNVLYGPY
jgi:hypothetical protein